MSNGRHNGKLTKIGLFMDGGYFKAVNDFYAFGHARKSRLSLEGIRQYVATEVARVEGVDQQFCRIVEAHYYRGRFPIAMAAERHHLLGQASFDDALIRSGIEAHYLPIGSQGTEKGVDVSLALDAFEGGCRGIDVIVLIAGDADFIPLFRKLHAIGVRIMLLAWNVSYTNSDGLKRSTWTSPELLKEATYPMRMERLIGDRNHTDDESTSMLFGIHRARAIESDASSANGIVSHSRQPVACVA